jgi:hypothetical protein
MRGGTAWAIVAVAFVAVGEAYELTQKDREIIDGLKIPDLKRLLRERRVDRGDRHWRRSIRRISHATAEWIDLQVLGMRAARQSASAASRSRTSSTDC